MSNDLYRVVTEIAAQHNLYAANAYYFILDALSVTARKVKKQNPSHSRHLSGLELSNGIKNYALKRFGCMSYTVMSVWGLHRTNDFGSIVYHLINAGVLGKSDEDSLEDFNDLFDFTSAFLKPFNP